MTLSRHRRAGSSSLWLAFLGSAVLLAGLVGLLVWDPEKWFSTTATISDLGTVEWGLAMIPSGSEIASPMRLVP